MASFSISFACIHTLPIKAHQAWFNRRTTQSFASLGAYLLACFHLRPGLGSQTSLERVLLPGDRPPGAPIKGRDFSCFERCWLCLKIHHFCLSLLGLLVQLQAVGLTQSLGPHQRQKNLPVLLFAVWSAITVSIFWRRILLDHILRYSESRGVTIASSLCCHLDDTKVLRVSTFSFLFSCLSHYSHKRSLVFVVVTIDFVVFVWGVMVCCLPLPSSILGERVSKAPYLRVNNGNIMNIPTH